MEIVTAHKGKAHVTAEKMAELNRGIVGAESYVMDGGRQFESELVSNNLLKVYDGSGMMQGRHICIPVGQSDELTIENGNQGMKRIDLVVVRYTKDENTKIENAETIVIKGTPSESDPVVPAYIEGDIRSGDMTVDWPLYEVELDGISVVEVRPVFKALMDISTINKYLSDLSSEKIDNYKFGPIFPATKTGEYLNSAPIYTKMIDVGALPNNSSKSVNTGIEDANYIWIDTGNSHVFKGGGTYPIPHVDPSNSKNSISCRITGGGATIIITTGTNWDGYSALVTVKYTKK